MSQQRSINIAQQATFKHGHGNGFTPDEGRRHHRSRHPPQVSRPGGQCFQLPVRINKHSLARVIGDKAEEAYRRSDALEKRSELPEAWAAYCAPKLPATLRKCEKVAILNLADRTGRANAVPRSHRPRYRLPLSSSPLVAMSLDYAIAMRVFLFVGHSVSTSELPVNGFPTDADFNLAPGRRRG